MLSNKNNILQSCEISVILPSKITIYQVKAFQARSNKISEVRPSKISEVRPSKISVVRPSKISGALFF